MKRWALVLAAWSPLCNVPSPQPVPGADSRWGYGKAVYIDHLAELPHVKTLTSQSAMKVVKRTHVLPIPPR